MPDRHLGECVRSAPPPYPLKRLPFTQDKTATIDLNMVDSRNSWKKKKREGFYTSYAVVAAISFLAKLEKARDCVMTIYLLLPLIAFLSGGLILFFERKVIALAQKRLGISMLGRHGWVHLIADVIKFWSKGWNQFSSSTYLGILGHIGFLLVWTICGVLFTLPSTTTALDPWEFQFLWYLLYANLSSFLFLSLILNTKSKYAVIAGIRVGFLSAFLELVFLALFNLMYFFSGSITLEAYCLRPTWLLLLCPVWGLLLVIFILFESRRAPFDHTEAESELVAGHLIEYGGRALLCLFICEYLHLFLGLFTFLVFLIAAGSYPAFYNILLLVL